MNAILIYGSCYGTTRRYAEELSRRTGFPAVPVGDMPEDLSPFDTVVHLGGLYAEKVMGLRKTAEHLPPSARLLAVTVGLGDPSVPATAAHLRKSLEKQLPAEVLPRTEFFHLRGAMDMEKLTLRHKMMLKAFFAVMSRTAAGKESGFRERREGPVDYVDFSALDPLVSRLSGEGTSSPEGAGPS